MGRPVAALMLAVIACGGGETSSGGEFDYPQPNPSPPSELQRQQPVIQPTGVVHEVEMWEVTEGRYAFAPATLTINEGDRVRWVVVDGVPHNVAFYPESIPPGAAQFVADAIPPEGRISPLGGRIMIRAGDTFEILFAGAPLGAYRYFCVPHEFAGMKGTIHVRAR